MLGKCGVEGILILSTWTIVTSKQFTTFNIEMSILRKVKLKNRSGSEVGSCYQIVTLLESKAKFSRELLNMQDPSRGLRCPAFLSNYLFEDVMLSGQRSTFLDICQSSSLPEDLSNASGELSPDLNLLENGSVMQCACNIMHVHFINQYAVAK